ncbi:hypothetical protein EPO56_01395 [Patescibacteria group bacterium]|nr:MAG: hypothetical protein EPO56_01395 [Patescibacteria group bacterium]
MKTLLSKIFNITTNQYIAFFLGALTVAFLWYLQSPQEILIDSRDSSTNIFQVASSTGENYFTITSDGKIGVNHEAPTTALDVYGVIRVYDHNSYECTYEIEGAIHYRGIDKHFWGCDGVKWHRLD